MVFALHSASTGEVACRPFSQRVTVSSVVFLRYLSTGCECSSGEVTERSHCPSRASLSRRAYTGKTYSKKSRAAAVLSTDQKGRHMLALNPAPTSRDLE